MFWIKRLINLDVVLLIAIFLVNCSGRKESSYAKVVKVKGKLMLEGPKGAKDRNFSHIMDVAVDSEDNL